MNKNFKETKYYSFIENIKCHPYNKNGKMKVKSAPCQSLLAYYVDKIFFKHCLV